MILKTQSKRILHVWILYQMNAEDNRVQIGSVVWNLAKQDLWYNWSNRQWVVEKNTRRKCTSSQIQFYVWDIQVVAPDWIFFDIQLSFCDPPDPPQIISDNYFLISSNYFWVSKIVRVLTSTVVNGWKPRKMTRWTARFHGLNMAKNAWSNSRKPVVSKYPIPWNKNLLETYGFKHFPKTRNIQKFAVPMDWIWRSLTVRDIVYYFSRGFWTKTCFFLRQPDRLEFF